MDNFVTSYACSPTVLGSLRGAHSTGVAGTWTPFGRSVTTGGALLLAPRPTTGEGTGLSIAMRDKSTIAATAIASLPISDVVVFGDNAGIRTWSPPV